MANFDGRHFDVPPYGSSLFFQKQVGETTILYCNMLPFIGDDSYVTAATVQGSPPAGLGTITCTVPGGQPTYFTIKWTAGTTATSGTVLFRVTHNNTEVKEFNLDLLVQDC